MPRQRSNLGGWQFVSERSLASILNQPAGTLSRSCSPSFGPHGPFTRIMPIPLLLGPGSGLGKPRPSGTRNSCQFFSACPGAGDWPSKVRALAGESGPRRTSQARATRRPLVRAPGTTPLGPKEPSSRALFQIPNSRRPGSHTAIAYIPPLPTHPVGSGAPPRPICHLGPPALCSIAARLRR